MIMHLANMSCDFIETISSGNQKQNKIRAPFRHLIVKSSFFCKNGSTQNCKIISDQDKDSLFSCFLQDIFQFRIFYGV